MDWGAWLLMSAVGTELRGVRWPSRYTEVWVKRRVQKKVLASNPWGSPALTYITELVALNGLSRRGSCLSGCHRFVTAGGDWFWEELLSAFDEITGL